jgi:hypothetical protein
MPDRLEDILLNRQLMSSHKPEPRTTGATIGPLTGNEKPFYTLDFTERRVSPADMLGKAAQGITNMFDIQSGMEAGDPLGGVGEAITAFHPAALRAVRASGQSLAERIAKEGLEKTSLGLPVYTPPLGKFTREHGNTPGIMDKWKAVRRPRLNTHPNPEVTDAIQIAQQRWPRLFGHVIDIKDLDYFSELKYGSGNLQGMRQPPTRNLDAPLGTSLIRLNPETEPTTIAHEMLHAADALTMGDKEFTKPKPPRRL